MQVVATVVPGALLLGPGRTGPGSGPVPDLSMFTLRRRRQPSRGAVHGLHGHLDEPVLVRVLSGAGYTAVIDARPDAGTFGRLAVTLVEDDAMLLVPPGCLYGVQAVAGETVVEVRAAVLPAEREQLRADPDDPDLNIRWLDPRPRRTPDDDRSWDALCSRLGAPPGPRRDRVSLW
ncbi:dTDP-4-dehydrorhamnose 3,5-epimerase family protein [Pseudonocardia sp. HH130630-07]|uniref:dTDP-4-dehydrorhamnose 3,5-epimerase family protein n=1 Tax=Pseudonocardia sp. HH130630-07 TaxID=1690815 RepID=UPI000814CA7E|nr:dTDP-4-dehydrorhamnose 3,5-epimerase family protein [Pseudonocardia sp. HH130630-07]ANY06795.1 hypothetical protein AFB00_11390 [Pseudonocardia sp. HH130630-07]